MGRSRGGLTSKIHAVVDTNGLPVRLGLTAGEAHDNRLALSFLSRLRSGSMLLADRGYDADWIRAFATERGAWANVPPRSNRRELICFSPHLYRALNLVERFFNKIKQCMPNRTPWRGGTHSIRRRRRILEKTMVASRSGGCTNSSAFHVRQFLRTSPGVVSVDHPAAVPLALAEGFLARRSMPRPRTFIFSL